jgi:hypothetical protein
MIRRCILTKFSSLPVPVAARSKAWVCGRLLAGIQSSNAAGGMDGCRECSVLSGRGICVGLITRPKESYRVWCGWVWWILGSMVALAQKGCCVTAK